MVLTVISSLFFSISLSWAAAVKNGLLISVNLKLNVNSKIKLEVRFAHLPFLNRSLSEAT